MGRASAGPLQEAPPCFQRDPEKRAQRAEWGLLLLPSPLLPGHQGKAEEASRWLGGPGRRGPWQGRFRGYAHPLMLFPFGPKAPNWRVWHTQYSLWWPTRPWAPSPSTSGGSEGPGCSTQPGWMQHPHQEVLRLAPGLGVTQIPYPGLHGEETSPGFLQTRL